MCIFIYKPNVITVTLSNIYTTVFRVERFNNRTRNREIV